MRDQYWKIDIFIITVPKFRTSREDFAVEAFKFIVPITPCNLVKGEGKTLTCDKKRCKRSITANSLDANNEAEVQDEKTPGNGLDDSSKVIQCYHKG